MAGGLSNFLRNKLINHSTSFATYTPTGVMYVALYTNSVNAAGTGTQVVGGSYAPAAVTFAAAASGIAHSAGAVTFTNMPSCTVVSTAIWDDSAAAGNMLWFKDLAAPIVVVPGSSFTAIAGDIIVELDN